MSAKPESTQLAGRRRRSPLRLSIPMVALTGIALSVHGCAVDTEAPETHSSSAAVTYWHAGSLRYLPAMHEDLVAFAENLPHPKQSDWGNVSTERAGRFRTFVGALFEAIDDGHSDGWAGDWCNVQALADDAGYVVRRLRDTQSGRWFVYAYDRTKYGQAYFFVNPFAKRNLVIEVPHAGPSPGGEWQIAEQGARLFKSLAARVLIVNKEHRCSDESTLTCTPGSSCTARSDVAHNVANTFQILHAWLSDNDANTKFAQIHGMEGEDDSYAEIGDGTRTDVYDKSISVEFANRLKAEVPNPSWVHSCQAYTGKPPAGHCGDTNAQGRYTNGGAINSTTGCPGSTVNVKYGRFLHIEQKKTLRDNDSSDGWWWGSISKALARTWKCNDGSTNCSIGGSQTNYSDLQCN